MHRGKQINVGLCAIMCMCTPSCVHVRECVCVCVYTCVCMCVHGACVCVGAYVCACVCV